MTKNKFISYDKCISYLFNLERAGIKYDLKNIKTLLELLNNPQKYFKSIHVAGTNGKGSVSSVLNSVLIEKKIRTGLYTSPHLTDYRERILVNGEFISKKFILNFVNRLYSEIEKIKPSFFEVTTALAFEYFSYKKIEYAVIETGLGGRLDSTNIIKPVLSVITTISIDHVNFLGNTIKSITNEKGGIIKNSIPVVVGNVSEESAVILREIAKKNKSFIFFSGNQNVKLIEKTEEGSYFTVKNYVKKLFYPVIGKYQIKNLKTILTAAEVLNQTEKLNINIRTIRIALKNLKQNSKLHGRFELISQKPKTIIDVSHNLQSIKNIKENLKYFKYEKLFIVFAMMQDKYYGECVNELQKLKGVIILTKPEIKRAAEPEILLDSVRSSKSKFIIKSELENAIRYAKENANSNDMILVTGSFYLAGEFLSMHNKFNKSSQ